MYFGVDVGGTAVKWATVADDYQIGKRGVFPTPYEDAEYLAEKIAAVYWQEGQGCQAIGISIPGTLRDDEDGTIEGGGALKYLDKIPFGKMIRRKCNVPCFVENDGKSCALGEYTAGALKGCRTGVALALGTGVGGGIIIDGKIYKGSHFFAGEFSFIMEECGKKLGEGMTVGASCGWSSGLREGLLRRKKDVFNAEMDGRQIFDLIENGDPAAVAALKDFCDHLAAQIHNIQMILDPDLFAIGGGISNQPILMTTLQKSLNYIYEGSAYSQVPIPRIVHCKNGDAANLLGAVCRCRQRLEAG